jgi:plastocyanin
MLMKHVLVTCAIVAAAGAAVAAQADAGSTRRPQKKTVTIGDNFYAPAKLTVNRGSTITWKWPTDVGDTHDVKLEKGPKGAKRFQSDSAATDATFKQKLTKPGVYKIICTFHDDMRMTITVRH